MTLAATQPYRAPKAPARAFARTLNIVLWSWRILAWLYTFLSAGAAKKRRLKPKLKPKEHALPCFSLSWNASPSFGPEKWVWFGGPRGVASPVPDYLASFDQLHSCATLLLSLSLNPAEAQADMLAA